LHPQIMSTQEHIHPIFDRILQRADKEALLGQQAKVIWLTGLSGSGKSTIAQHAEKIFHQKGLLTMLLDGDNIRTGINNNLTFSDTDRIENIRRIAEVSKLFLNCGIITLNSFVSPTNEIRKMAREIIGEDDFMEIYVNAPLEVCEARDVKGLYAKARKGLIPDFTGITAPFEAPENPALEIRTDQMEVNESVQMLMDFILPIVEHQKA
jgi:adenylylsulfate kinase